MGLHEAMVWLQAVGVFLAAGILFTALYGVFDQRYKARLREREEEDMDEYFRRIDPDYTPRVNPNLR